MNNRVTFHLDFHLQLLIVETWLILNYAITKEIAFLEIKPGNISKMSELFLKPISEKKSALFWFFVIYSRETKNTASIFWNTTK